MNYTIFFFCPLWLSLFSSKFLSLSLPPFFPSSLPLSSFVFLFCLYVLVTNLPVKGFPQMSRDSGFCWAIHFQIKFQKNLFVNKADRLVALTEVLLVVALLHVFRMEFHMSHFLPSFPQKLDRVLDNKTKLASINNVFLLFNFYSHT